MRLGVFAQLEIEGCAELEFDWSVRMGRIEVLNCLIEVTFVGSGGAEADDHGCGGNSQPTQQHVTPWQDDSSARFDGGVANQNSHNHGDDAEGTSVGSQLDFLTIFSVGIQLSHGTGDIRHNLSEADCVFGNVRIAFEPLSLVKKIPLTMRNIRRSFLNQSRGHARPGWDFSFLLEVKVFFWGRGRGGGRGISCLDGAGVKAERKNQACEEALLGDFKAVF